MYCVCVWGGGEHRALLEIIGLPPLAEILVPPIAHESGKESI